MRQSQLSPPLSGNFLEPKLKVGGEEGRGQNSHSNNSNNIYWAHNKSVLNNQHELLQLTLTILSSSIIVSFFMKKLIPQLELLRFMFLLHV